MIESVQDIITEKEVKVSNFLLAFLNILLTAILTATGYGVAVVSDIRDVVQEIRIDSRVQQAEITHNNELIKTHINNQDVHYRGTHTK